MTIFTALQSFVNRLFEAPAQEGCRQIVADELEDDQEEETPPSQPSVTGLKAGDLLQSTTMACMQAIIDEEIQPGFYAWHLARPNREGGFEPYGFIRYSEIDPQMWTPRK
jgi:hypothetical protein